MGKLIMVTGGKKSGKSDFVQGLCESFGDSILYIATLVPEDDDDEETKCRIEYRKALRPKSWDTLEAYDGIAGHIEAIGAGYDGIVLDRVSVMVTQLMGEYDTLWETVPMSLVLEIEKAVTQEVRRVLKAAKEIPTPMILVTNELGMGSRPVDRFDQIRRQITCRINTKIAAQADEVYLMVSGIPMKIKHSVK